MCVLHALLTVVIWARLCVCVYECTVHKYDLSSERRVCRVVYATILIISGEVCNMRKVTKTEIERTSEDNEFIDRSTCTDIAVSTNSIRYVLFLISLLFPIPTNFFFLLFYRCNHSLFTMFASIVSLRIFPFYFAFAFVETTRLCKTNHEKMYRTMYEQNSTDQIGNESTSGKKSKKQKKRKAKNSLHCDTNGLVWIYVLIYWSLDFESCLARLFFIQMVIKGALNWTIELLN